jgi:PIN domain nuclease of toxin-antitoxin system
MSNCVILDTHTLLWSLLKPEELLDKVKSKIEQAQKDQRLLFSSISLWEIAMLSHKKRIHIFEPVKNFLSSIEEISGINICEISAEIAAESIALKNNFHGDPADRIIVATARSYSATLFTRDKQILEWSADGAVKCLEV